VDWSTYRILAVECEDKEQSWSLKHTLKCEWNIKTYIRGNGSENANLGLARSTELAARFCKYGVKKLYIIKKWNIFIATDVKTWTTSAPRREWGQMWITRCMLEMIVLTHINLETPYVTCHKVNLLLCATALWNLYHLFTRYMSLDTFTITCSITYVWFCYISLSESGFITLLLGCTPSSSLFLFVSRFAGCNTNLKIKWMDILIVLACRNTTLEL
jgi:hypothetical protein